MFNFTKIIVTPSAMENDVTKDIVSRVKLLSPNSVIEFSNHEESKMKYPQHMTLQEKIKNLKDTLVLTTRKSTPFVTTFASPGKIVENLGNILTLGWHCQSQCDFCYLLGSAFQVQHQMLYTNLNRLADEISREVYLNRAVLSLWSALSFYKEEEFQKIPEGFQNASNLLREKMLKQKVGSDKEALECLENNLSSLFKKHLVEKVDQDRLSSIQQKLPEYYMENSQFVSWLNVSEYTDIIAIDPISSNLNFLMQQIEKHPELHISFRTKSANFQNLLKYKGHNRVKITMNFNTAHIINKHEAGTSSLADRINAAKSVQMKGGYLLKLAIEPIITYPGYEEDYRVLAEKLMNELDTQDLVDITFGTVRYKGKLKSIITSLNPGTDLFSEDQKLIAIKSDRIRYEEDEREKVYKILIKEFSKHTSIPLRLGAETPEMWEKAGLNTKTHISKSVYQFQSVLQDKNDD